MLPQQNADILTSYISEHSDKKVVSVERNIGDEEPDREMVVKREKWIQGPDQS